MWFTLWDRDPGATGKKYLRLPEKYSAGGRCAFDEHGRKCSRVRFGTCFIEKKGVPLKKFFPNGNAMA